MIRSKNPFQSVDAKTYSHYGTYQEDRFQFPENSIISSHTSEKIHTLLREKIVVDKYSCVAAQATFNQASYRIGIYPEIAKENVTQGIAHDLYRFVTDTENSDEDFSTFIAVFLNPDNLTEKEFEQLLWEQLQLLHRLDSQYHKWNPKYSPDPKDKNFGFSFAHTGFFIVGMHNQSSRLARQFPYPTMVFNRHSQFEALKEQEHFETMKQTIRDRELALQGSINPMLSDFGEHSEAPQYSGRAVSEDWQCPFHAVKTEEV